MADMLGKYGDTPGIGIDDTGFNIKGKKDASGNTMLVEADGAAYTVIHSARMNPKDAEGSRLGTIIPTSAAGTAGLFATKVLFTGAESVIFDTLGGVADYANGRMIIPDGFRYCRVGYSMAFAANDVGWRGCRIKNSSGGNYGNQRIGTVGLGATTNSQYTSPWIMILPAGDSAISAPDSIGVGDYFELYPAQTSGGDLEAMADLASSWFHLELMR